MMKEVAYATYSYELFPQVMGMVQKRMMGGTRKNWRRIYKVIFSLIYSRICQ